MGEGGDDDAKWLMMYECGVRGLGWLDPKRKFAYSGERELDNAFCTATCFAPYW